MPPKVSPDELAKLQEQASALRAKLEEVNARIQAAIQEGAATPTRVEAQADPQPRSKKRIPDRITFDDEDLRCPHCGIVVLKAGRINLGAERGGAPEFCPKCGLRTGEEPPPLPLPGA